jgi:hypothetical protein
MEVGLTIPWWVMFLLPGVLGTLIAIMASWNAGDWDFGAAFLSMGALCVGWVATLALFVGRCVA